MRWKLPRTCADQAYCTRNFSVRALTQERTPFETRPFPNYVIAGRSHDLKLPPCWPCASLSESIPVTLPAYSAV